MTVFSAIRQFRFPQEFRIMTAPWPANLDQLLVGLMRSAEVASEPQVAAPAEHDVRLLADICTGLWRLRQKLVKPGTTQPLDEMRRPYRHLESVWDALAQAGAEIQDHTDKPFDTGMSLIVISYQPTPGLGRERIIETIKPTIYFKGKPIQMGEVIVGTPEKIMEPQGGGRLNDANDD